ncbi:DUF362 domain-containing protein [Candidatus Thorarchaeota archaeon]|nr:MAG: DUF362 domain-containing protein [Candidatus Thorarchaeota archaeon]
MNSSSPYIRDGKFLVSKIPVGENLKSAIRTAVDLIGGFDKVILQDDIVTIKPNLNTADPYPASSDPMFIKDLGELLLDAGAGKLKIIESSTMRLSARKVSDTVGLTSVANELDAELIFLDEHKWMKVDIPSGKYIKSASIGEPLLARGKLVLAPCLKTHFLARYTGSMKLFVGWIKHRERIRMHMKNLEPKIADLASYFNPDLIVMDARTCFITGGPASGQCSTPNLILASGDMVAIDVEGVRTIQCCNAKNKLGMDVWEIPQIRRAVEIGIGAQSDNDIEIVTP